MVGFFPPVLFLLAAITLVTNHYRLVLREGANPNAREITAFPLCAATMAFGFYTIADLAHGEPAGVLYAKCGIVIFSFGTVFMLAVHFAMVLMQTVYPDLKKPAKTG